MDLNSGKPDWRDLGPLLGLVLILIIPSGIGGAMIVANWPTEDMSKWQALWFALGATLAFVFGSFIWMLRGSLAREIRSYQDRRDEWHYVQLAKYEASDGMVTAQQVSEWVYSSNDMRSIGAFFFWLLVTQPRSLSIEYLTRGPLMLDIGHRSIKMLDMTQDGAADALNLLAAAGVMVGRAPRKAGTLTLADTPTLARRLAAEAAKNPALVAMPEVEK